ncbi:hypothetical protein IWQ61_010241 [Dispira simplex]|nr:hypothetical protein IWQ61_010241 [Dispira simplex]
MSSPPSSPLMSLIPTSLPSLTLVPNWVRSILTKADRGLDTIPTTIPHVADTDDDLSQSTVISPVQRLKRRPSDSDKRVDASKRATGTKSKPDVVIISDSDSDSSVANVQSGTDKLRRPFSPDVEASNKRSPSQSLATASLKQDWQKYPQGLSDNFHDSLLPGTLSSVPKAEPLPHRQSRAESCNHERKWRTPSPYKRRDNLSLSTAARGWRTAPTSTRNKAVRRQMVGVACTCCEEFYKQCDLPLSSLDLFQGPRFSRRNDPSSSSSHIKSKNDASPGGQTESSPSRCLASGNDQTALAKRINFVSRHRHHAGELPQGDPSGYWDVNLPEF